MSQSSGFGDGPGRPTSGTFTKPRERAPHIQIMADNMGAQDEETKEEPEFKLEAIPTDEELQDLIKAVPLNEED